MVVEQQQQQRRRKRSLNDVTNRSLPLTYYDELRNIAWPWPSQEGGGEASNYNGVISEKPESAVVQVENVRLGHILTMIPFTSSTDEGGRVVSAGRTSVNVGGFLAYQHFNDRSNAVIPDLSERLDGCNFYFTMNMVDTQSSMRLAVGTYQDFSRRVGWRKPPAMALAGTGRSSTSIPVSVLSGIFETPMVSCCASSKDLDNKFNHPYFARTISTVEGDARAAVLFYQSLGVTHFGVLYAGDAYGREYSVAIKNIAEEMDLSVSLFEVQVTLGQSLHNAIAQIKASEMRYFYGVFYFPMHEEIMTAAFNGGVMGNQDFVWTFSDGLAEIRSGGYTTELDSPLAKTVNGIGILTMDIPPNELYNEAVDAFHEDVELQEYFRSRVTDPDLLDGFDMTGTFPLFFALLHYDAVMSLGLAACEAETALFDAKEFYETLKHLDFEGASGRVQFDNNTGTRSAGIRFGIYNIVANNVPNEEGLITFTSTLSTTVDFARVHNEVLELEPFIFNPGTSEVPISLPEITMQENKLASGTQIVAWTVSGFIILWSLWWAWWTWKYRKKAIVRASQPFFLFMLLAGTVIMASAIIPLSFQEPMSPRALNIACMVSPWLVSLGFTTVFSALFTKTGRIFLIYRNSRKFRRVQIKVKDVIIPFVVLLLMNVGILTAWSVIDPLVHRRQEIDNVDHFGRTTETYSVCVPASGAQEDGGARVPWEFLGPLLSLNFVALALSNYLAFKSRDLPSQFNESSYTWLTMASLLETFIVAVPIVFVVWDDPSARFIAQSVLLVLFCLAVLLPTFIPKYTNKDSRKKSRLVRLSNHKHEDNNIVALRNFSGKVSHNGRRNSTVHLDNNNALREDWNSSINSHRTAISRSSRSKAGSMGAILSEIGEEFSRLDPEPPRTGEQRKVSFQG